MRDADLREDLIRLAHAKPELRGKLLPLLKTAMPVDVPEMASLLRAIEDEHESLMEEIEDLPSGPLRLATRKIAKLPKGLMPVAEATKIVSEVGQNLDRLHDYIRQLQHVSPAPGMEKEHAALIKRATTTAKRFQIDLAKAHKALERYRRYYGGKRLEEGLARLKSILASKPTQPGVRFKDDVEIHLDRRPPFAVAKVIFIAENNSFITFRIGYKADADEIYGRVILSPRGSSYGEIDEEVFRQKGGKWQITKLVKFGIEQANAHDMPIFTSRVKGLKERDFMTGLRELALQSARQKLKWDWGRADRYEGKPIGRDGARGIRITWDTTNQSGVATSVRIFDTRIKRNFRSGKRTMSRLLKAPEGRGWKGTPLEGSLWRFTVVKKEIAVKPKGYFVPYDPKNPEHQKMVNGTFTITVDAERIS